MPCTYVLSDTKKELVKIRKDLREACKRARMIQKSKSGSQKLKLDCAKEAQDIDKLLRKLKGIL